ncbi:MAG: hypothetical protein U1A77_10380 [Pirellulales bacterium]
MQGGVSQGDCEQFEPTQGDSRNGSVESTRTGCDTLLPAWMALKWEDKLPRRITK